MKYTIEKKQGKFYLFLLTETGREQLGVYSTEKGAEVAMYIHNDNARLDAQRGVSQDG